MFLSATRGLLTLVFGLVLTNLSYADFPVQVAEAPTNDLELTVSAIKSAHYSILLNIYELSSPVIADALVEQIQAGISVQIIEEGQPVGGQSAAAKGIESKIAQAMQQARNGDHFYIMSSKASGSKRRFRYDHGKYAVIDDKALLIGSENYSPTGNPSPGATGNRGWEVFVQNPEIAASYKTVFTGDADPSSGDLIDITTGTTQVLLFNPADSSLDSFLNIRRPPPPAADAPAKPRTRRKPGQPVEDPSSPPSDAPPSNSNPGLPGDSLSANEIVPVHSPDTSLSGLVDLLDRATQSIDIEQMTFDSAWSGSENPLIAAVIKAADRGVQVRVLLNDEIAFSHGSTPGKSKNLPTISLLSQHQNIQAKTANIKGMGVDYIHNKGALVDGNKTLISSINWDQNSIENNREAAVVITSASVNAHYKALFNSDWSK